MNLKEKILELVEEKERLTTKEIVDKYKISRQFVSRVIKGLIIEGKIIKIGSTKSAFYTIPEKATDFGFALKKRFKNKNLEEHKILTIFKKNMPSLALLKDNVGRIFDYAFSEMTNNAIEHSKSKTIEIEINQKGKDNLMFSINDGGIGTFQSIIRKKHLNSELEAIRDLLKGKTTTNPKSHSGEGIFFTSKIVDIFILESSSYRLKIDNIINDVFIEPLDQRKNGTRVEFLININADKSLTEIFRKFQTGSEYDFDKTEVKINLYALDTDYISRSQARRLLSGLDKFKTIILDFKNVKTIGQAFADEIFRIFKEAYPAIVIKTINTNEVVDFMINRAIKK